MPPFDATTPVDLIVDGASLQALRVATGDFFPPSSKPQACADTLAAHKFKVSRRGDIIFVQISQDPEACGWRGFRLDGAVRYAISLDGRILRRVLDGEEPEEAIPDDAGESFRLVPLKADGGPDFQAPPPCPLGPYAPVSLFEGQPICEGADGGTRDGGTASAPDGGVDPGPDGGAGASARKPTPPRR